VTEPRVERTLLPDTTSDEQEVGWGDDLSDDGSDEAADDKRLIEDRPPHYDQE
jgi:hypothetical protein